MDIEKALEAYINWLNIRNYSDESIRSYSCELNKYFRWVKDRLGEQEINIEKLKIITWQNIEDEYLPMGKVLNSTFNKRHASLKGFYKFLKKRGYIDYNPLDDIEKLKLPKKDPVYLSKEEVNELLEELNNSEETNSLRNHCIIKVFLETGMRISEVANFKKWDLKRGTIKVVGKGDKERYVFISAQTEAMLLTYWTEREDSSPYAFVTSRGEARQMNTESIRNVVNDKIDLICGDKRITPHKLRHTFATTYYDKTKDLRRLQEILGHSSSKTTDIYTHITNSRVETAIEGLYDEEEEK